MWAYGSQVIQRPSWCGKIWTPCYLQALFHSELEILLHLESNPLNQLEAFLHSLSYPSPRQTTSTTSPSPKLFHGLGTHPFRLCLMALLRPQLQKFLSTKLQTCTSSGFKPTKKYTCPNKARTRCCSAIAIDAPSSVTGLSGVRWGSTTRQGPREEMEDDVVVRSDGLGGFSFAAVFDGHGGLSSVKFLRFVQMEII